MAATSPVGRQYCFIMLKLMIGISLHSIDDTTQNSNNTCKIVFTKRYKKNRPSDFVYNFDFACFF